MTQIKFTVPLEPIGKGRPRFSSVAGRPIAFTPAKTRHAENVFRVFARRAMNGQYPFDRKIPLKVDVTAFFTVPKSYSLSRRKRCLEGIETPTKKPDIDNIAKFILDGMNETIFWDDSQVIELNIKKLYGTEAKIVVLCEAIDNGYQTENTD